MLAPAAAGGRAYLGGAVTVLWIVWAVAAALILGLYAWVGRATGSGALGILIDTRGRYSLTRLQLSLWTLLTVSLLAGVFGARAATRGVDPLDISIPAELLGALGISVGSAVTAIGLKASKNRTRAKFVAASPPGAARPAQMLLVEEGPQADRTVDVTKLQNFLITVLLVAGYVALTIHTFAGWGPEPAVGGPADITSLPKFSATLLTLLGISHAGYLVAKAPNRGEDIVQDVPPLSVADMAVVRTLNRERGGGPDPAADDAATRRAVERQLDLEKARVSTRPPGE
jgi:hypothetical protein